ncbi:hypothetical protein HC928_02385 [bacterium]|nr:hypothetical protein [bacterium]
MVPLEPLFCPCCTPALLHSLAQSNPAMLPKQLLLLGTGALTAVLAQADLHQTTKATENKEYS